jgi:hypothetical protein
VREPAVLYDVTPTDIDTVMRVSMAEHHKVCAERRLSPCIKRLIARLQSASLPAPFRGLCSLFRRCHRSEVQRLFTTEWTM